LLGVSVLVAGVLFLLFDLDDFLVLLVDLPVSVEPLAVVPDLLVVSVLCAKPDIEAVKISANARVIRRFMD
jgi:hypothetical protein